MNKLKIILIDDEPRAILSLQFALEKNCPETEVIAQCDDPEQASQLIRQLQPDLVFLDIAMPGKTGLDLLKELGEIRFETIFVTAHDSYMIQALHFSAVDYLLKPVDDQLLSEAVKRAAKRIEEKTGGRQMDILLHNLQVKNRSQKMKLCIPSIKGFQVIEIRDIIYCEANNNYTNFHFAKRPLICASKPIYEYEQMLDDTGFVRIHKSFLINLEHVKEYVRGEGGVVLLSNGYQAEVSRRKKEQLLQRIRDYYKY